MCDQPNDGVRQPFRSASSRRPATRQALDGASPTRPRARTRSRGRTRRCIQEAPAGASTRSTGYGSVLPQAEAPRRRLPGPNPARSRQGPGARRDDGATQLLVRCDARDRPVRSPARRERRAQLGAPARHRIHRLSFVVAVWLGKGILGNLTNQGVLTKGVPATAQHLSMAETGTTVNQQPLVEFGLRVHRDGQEPYEVKVKQVLPRLLLGTVKPGIQVNVKVMPDDPRKSRDRLERPDRRRRPRRQDRRGHRLGPLRPDTLGHLTYSGVVGSPPAGRRARCTTHPVRARVRTSASRPAGAARGTPAPRRTRAAASATRPCWDVR